MLFRSLSNANELVLVHVPQFDFRYPFESAVYVRKLLVTKSVTALAVRE